MFLTQETNITYLEFSCLLQAWAIIIFELKVFGRSENAFEFKSNKLTVYHLYEIDFF